MRLSRTALRRNRIEVSGALKTKILTTAMLLQIIFAGCAFSAELGLDECIKTALEKHPDMVAAAAKIKSAQAGVGQAKSGALPQANASANYTRSDSTTAVEEKGRYGSGATVSQLVYDSGRVKLGVKGARLNTDAAEADYLQTRDNVIADVRAAYYGLNRSMREHEVAKTRYENYEKRLKWAKSYYEVGTKAKIEVTKAESDLANSRLTLVRAESSAAQYRAQLASAMGQPLLKIDGISDALSYTEWNVPIEEAVQRAIDNRPELLAKQKRVEYARTSLSLAMKGFSPSVSVSGGYNWEGAAPFDENGWNAKLSLSVPLFDGGLTKSKIEGARADLEAADAQFESLSNSVMLEVRKAWEAHLQSKEALSASLEAEKQAKATYDLAEGRYKAGVGDSLEISDAVDSYAAAQANTVLALYNCKQSQLELEKAIGGLENESE